MTKLLTKRNVLILLSVIFFFIAWNRAINLLYGMFALLVATILLALLLPRYSIRGIAVSRALLPTAFEGDEVLLAVTVRNGNWSSRSMIEVVDFFPAAEPGSQAPMSFVARLKGASVRQYAYRVTCYKRGEYQIGPILIRSAYPLGIWAAEKQVPGTSTPLLVYPRVFPIARLPLVSGSSMPMSGVEAVSKAGGSEEFFGTREYRQGDSLRYIHWPSTARHSQLIVKEFEVRAATEVTLVLDLHNNFDIGEGRETTLEYAVKIAASVAQYALERGHEVGLACYGEREHVLPGSRGLAHLAAIFETLAKIAATGRVPYAHALRRAADSMRDGGTAVLLFSRQSIAHEDFPASINLLLSRRIRLVSVFLDEQGFSTSPPKPGSASDPVLQNLFACSASFYSLSRGDSLAEVFA